MNGLNYYGSKTTTNLNSDAIDVLQLPNIVSSIVYTDKDGIANGVLDNVGVLHSDGAGTYSFDLVNSDDIDFGFTNGSRVVTSKADKTGIEESNMTTTKINLIDNFWTYGVNDVTYSNTTGGNLVITNQSATNTGTVTINGGSAISFNVASSNIELLLSNNIAEFNSRIKCNNISAYSASDASADIINFCNASTGTVRCALYLVNAFNLGKILYFDANKYFAESNFTIAANSITNANGSIIVGNIGKSTYTGNYVLYLGFSDGLIYEDTIGPSITTLNGFDGRISALESEVDLWSLVSNVIVPTSSAYPVTISNTLTSTGLNVSGLTNTGTSKQYLLFSDINKNVTNTSYWYLDMTDDRQILTGFDGTNYRNIKCASISCTSSCAAASFSLSSGIYADYLTNSEVGKQFLIMNQSDAKKLINLSQWYITTDNWLVGIDNGLYDSGLAVSQSYINTGEFTNSLKATAELLLGYGSTTTDLVLYKDHTSEKVTESTTSVTTLNGFDGRITALETDDLWQLVSSVIKPKSASYPVTISNTLKSNDFYIVNQAPASSFYSLLIDNTGKVLKATSNSKSLYCDTANWHFGSLNLTDIATINCSVVNSSGDVYGGNIRSNNLLSNGTSMQIITETGKHLFLRINANKPIFTCSATTNQLIIECNRIYTQVNDTANLKYYALQLSGTNDNNNVVVDATSNQFLMLSASSVDLSLKTHIPKQIYFYTGSTSSTPAMIIDVSNNITCAGNLTCVNLNTSGAVTLASVNTTTATITSFSTTQNYVLKNDASKNVVQDTNWYYDNSSNLTSSAKNVYCHYVVPSYALIGMFMRYSDTSYFSTNSTSAVLLQIFYGYTITDFYLPTNLDYIGSSVNNHAFNLIVAGTYKYDFVFDLFFTLLNLNETVTVKSYIGTTYITTHRTTCAGNTAQDQAFQLCGQGFITTTSANQLLSFQVYISNNTETLKLYGVKVNVQKI